MSSPHARIAAIILAAVAVGSAATSASPQQAQPADLIVTNANVHTVDDRRPRASAIAVKDGKFVAVGGAEVLQTYLGSSTRVIDAKGRAVIPGLNDSHLHAIRGGRFYNLELRWDGVASVERGLAMVREQAKRTPKGQWVRVVGGWSPFQFKEKRMPTVKELNEAAPDTPTFVLFLYSQGMINRAAVQALGLNGRTKNPDGGRYEFVDGGAILHAEPNPLILYQMIAKLPQLSPEEQINSTLHYYRELNRLGLTSAIDAGGGGHAFPKDYASSQAVASQGNLSIRIGYYLFAQTQGKEANDFGNWTSNYDAGKSAAMVLEHGYELEGGGEFLAHAVGDWENFLADKPDLDARKAAGQDPAGDLHEVATILVKNNWPLRQHATYGESIKLIMDVFEKVQKEQGRFSPRWAIDHAETIRDDELKRIKAMGGGIAIQSRMAFGGEYFLERYGKAAAARAPPIRKMLEMGIPVGAGSDGTRVASYNPWLTLYWLVSGKTVGGTQVFADDNKLSRGAAVRLYTVGSAWFSQEETVKGRIAPGQYADFAILTEDFFSVPEERIRNIESVLTAVGGKIVFAAAPFLDAAPPPLPPVIPTWSPVAHFGGYRNAETPGQSR
jgi:predicted amidohydrolase YtcJ